jgi:4-amino-4-deoxychorismate lyase
MLLFETIQIFNGKPQKLHYHNQRLNQSRQSLFCVDDVVFLENYIRVPAEFKHGLVKCRIEYEETIVEPLFEIYTPKAFNKFFLTEDSISYEFKFTERANLTRLKSKIASDAELIFTRDGLITDSTFSNLVFKDLKGLWFTPEAPLLHGTQREFLLDEGMIEEADIEANTLHQQYTHFMLINAMLPFDNARALPVDLIEKTPFPAVNFRL